MCPISLRVVGSSCVKQPVVCRNARWSGALSNVDFPRWYNPQSRPAASRSFCAGAAAQHAPWRTCSKSSSTCRCGGGYGGGRFPVGFRRGRACRSGRFCRRCLPHQMRPHTGQPRQYILVLRQLDSCSLPRRAARCAKMSKISAERSSTVHLVSSSKVPHLGRRQLVIEQNKRGPRSLLQAVAPPRPLPSPMKYARVRRRPARSVDGCRLGSGGFGQRFQLSHRAFVCVLLGGKARQDRPTSTARSTCFRFGFRSYGFLLSA